MKPVTNFYYSKRLPENAVSIARITAAHAVTPEAYIDKLNLFPASGQIGPGDLSAKAWPVEAHFFPAVGLGKPLAVNNDPANTGQSYEYTVQNQFVEVSNKWDDRNTYFYFHPLPAGILQVTILDSKKNPVSSPVLVEEGKLYHTLDGGLYWVKYFADNRFYEEVVQYQPVMRRQATKREGNAPNVAEGFWGWTHGVIDLPNRNEHRIRFTDDNRYQILNPYTSLPNDPWYPRIRFNVKPMPPEWCRMNFAPYRPYMVATWVPGKLVAPGVIEFERKRIYFDGSKYPDVLVFNKNYEIKHALDGNPIGSPETEGYLYPWAKNRFVSCDALNGRVKVNAEIASDDIIFGFYFYEEPDLIYTALDINPFSNPDVRNRVVEFVYRESASSPERSIWHRIYGADGQVIPELSPEPEDGTPYVIGRLVVGGSVSLNEFTVSDLRVRGGGIKDEFVTRPAAANLWDAGYWDGKPYPVKGGLVVYLPVSLKERFTEQFIASTVAATVPVGTVPVIRYYSPDGEEQ